MLRKLKPEQIMHLSCVFGLHSTIWDRVQLSPPMSLLGWRVRERLQYLALDDALLVRDGGIRELKKEEVIHACDERGQDTLGKPEEQLRKLLEWWVARQKEDEGRGHAMMDMVFKR